jgi:hypothetical protein
MAPNEKTQPIQWTERPTGALVAVNSLWPGYLASRLLKHWSLTFDRVTDSLIFNMDCVSNGLGHS